jgi:integrase
MDHKRFIPTDSLSLPYSFRVRLHEKGGKEHDVPSHHNLDHFLDEYIVASGIAGDANGYLFRTTMRRSGILTEKPLHQQDAYRMIQRRAKAAGIETKIGNHSFRATGITAYLKNSGKLEVARWHSTSPTMNHLGRRSFTTGGRMRFLSMRSNASPSKAIPLYLENDGRLEHAQQMAGP